MKVWDFRFFLVEMCPFSNNLSIDFFTKTAKLWSTQNVFASRMEEFLKIIKQAGSNKGKQGGKSGKMLK